MGVGGGGREHKTCTFHSRWRSTGERGRALMVTGAPWVHFGTCKRLQSDTYFDFARVFLRGSIDMAPLHKHAKRRGAKKSWSECGSERCIYVLL